jgi:hypothetical protein
MCPKRELKTIVLPYYSILFHWPAGRRARKPYKPSILPVKLLFIVL